jgi:hypothetical protein
MNWSSLSHENCHSTHHTTYPVYLVAHPQQQQLLLLHPVLASVVVEEEALTTHQEHLLLLACPYTAADSDSLLSPGRRKGVVKDKFPRIPYVCSERVQQDTNLFVQIR